MLLTRQLVRALFDQTEKEFGPIDVLVNNAGILKNAPLAQVTDEDYQRQIAVNLTGTFNGMREAAKRVRDGGRIINLSTSILGTYLPTYGVYAATKAAVEAMDPHSRQRTWQPPCHGQCRSSRARGYRIIFNGQV